MRALRDIGCVILRCALYLAASKDAYCGHPSRLARGRTSSVSSTTGKRFIFAIFSLIGVIAYSVNGTPLDVNLISSIASMLLTTSAGAFLAAHGSYGLINE
jgi:hypothetical protein